MSSFSLTILRSTLPKAENKGCFTNSQFLLCKFFPSLPPKPYSDQLSTYLISQAAHRNRFRPHQFRESEVREARKLKASHEHIELLKERLVEEKGRRERVETELHKLQEVQQSMEILEDELSSWKKVIKDIPGVSSSHDISLKFAALQNKPLVVVYSVFCPDCQDTGLQIEGDELEKPTFPLSQMFKYKIAASDAHRAWMKCPEQLENCSTGFAFSFQTDDAQNINTQIVLSAHWAWRMDRLRDVAALRRATHNNIIPVQLIDLG